MTFAPITTPEQFEARLRARLHRLFVRHRDELAECRAEQELVVRDLKDHVDRLQNLLVEAEARVIAGEIGFIDAATAVRAAEATVGIATTTSGQVDAETIRRRLVEFATRSPYFLHPDRRSTA